jgi:hypothetical protein
LYAEEAATGRGEEGDGGSTGKGVGITTFERLLAGLFVALAVRGRTVVSALRVASSEVNKIIGLVDFQMMI